MKKDAQYPSSSNSAKSTNRGPLEASLLDRLIEEPDKPQIKSGTVAFKASLLRDLENLLNTRVFQQKNLDVYSELPRSLLTYGLPDFSRIQFEIEAHRQDFAEQVQAVIACFEPRLDAIQVSIMPVKNTYERILYLRIVATIKTLPEPIPVVFESQVRSMDRAVRLKELPYG